MTVSPAHCAYCLTPIQLTPYEPWPLLPTQAHQQTMQTLLKSVLCRRVGDKQAKRSLLDSLVFNGNMSLGQNGMAEGWKAFGEGYSWYVHISVLTHGAYTPPRPGLPPGGEYRAGGRVHTRPAELPQPWGTNSWQLH